MTKSYKGNKGYLPTKLCKTCGKEFTRRKKWKKTRESVKYCSKKCSSKK